MVLCVGVKNGFFKQFKGMGVFGFFRLGDSKFLSKLKVKKEKVVKLKVEKKVKKKFKVKVKVEKKLKEKVIFR